MKTVRPAVVLSGLWLIVFGLLFLADLHTGLDLRPMLIWPVLIIAWGSTLLVGGLTDTR